MKKSELLSVSSDGKYGLNWGSGGTIEIVELETGDFAYALYDNECHWTIRAVFSRDMRRILCLNWDGTVGVWSVPRYGASLRINTIMDALLFSEEEFVLRQAHLYHG